MKIRPVEAEFLRADGQSNMTMVTKIFCNFIKGLKVSETVHPLTLTPLFMDRYSNYFTFHT
jgi:hypothetical protein